MKINFTKREIELLLLLIGDATKGKFSLDGDAILTNEEEKIIEKPAYALDWSNIIL